MKFHHAVLPVLAILIAFIPRLSTAGEVDHSDYDAFLKMHVRDGLVNYSAVKSDDRRLADYLRRLEKIDPEDFENWSRDAKMAFWINAYNAVTIYGIVLSYLIEYGGLIARARFPESSIRRIGGFWDTVFIKISGREITLNEIEHEILRKEFADPRMHFSLVCAARGCPVLSNDAYTGKSLNDQLEHDARRFINDEDKVRLDKSGNRIYLSSIFKWYAADFEYDDPAAWLKKYKKKYRGVMKAVARYIEKEKRDYITGNSPGLKFLDYDWSLNELTTGIEERDVPE